MMSHDTFLIDWLSHEETNVKKITRYLESIQNKYQMFTVFLASETTKNYYTSQGLLETLTPDNPDNKWYYEFKGTPELNEVNIDYNNHMSTEMIMFINHKILNTDYNMIGATGVGLKTSYVNEMLKNFRQRYNFNVYFIEQTGKVIIAESGTNTPKNLNEIPVLKALLPDIISKTEQVITYSKSKEDYLLNKKYIPELDLHLIVEARVKDFTTPVTETLYINIIISLFITVLICFIILLYVRKIHLKLNNLAIHDELTGLSNRRSFHNKLAQFLILKDRKNTNHSIIFIDIDDFKYINDSQGHHIGDKTLQLLAKILDENTRKSDLVARWGGEEFVILLGDTDTQQATQIANKLRNKVADNSDLVKIAKQKVTISLGVTSLTPEDNESTLLKRADNALYKAKSMNKNCVVLA